MYVCVYVCVCERESVCVCVRERERVGVSVRVDGCLGVDECVWVCCVRVCESNRLAHPHSVCV